MKSFQCYFHFSVSDCFLVKNCRCLVYASYGQLISLMITLPEAENIQRFGRTNELSAQRSINDSYTDAKIMPLSGVIRNPNNINTHTTHTPVRLSLHFADTGVVMRRVAYKTKQRFPLERKTNIYLTKYPCSQISRATINAKTHFLPN